MGEGDKRERQGRREEDVGKRHREGLREKDAGGVKLRCSEGRRSGIVVGVGVDERRERCRERNGGRGRVGELRWRKIEAVG